MSNLPTFNYEMGYHGSIDPSSLQPPPPPSSVHGEVDEDDNHLRVDDSFHHRDVNYDSANDDDAHLDNSVPNNFNMGAVPDDDALMAGQNEQLNHPPIVPSPQQPELTLKERLVLRERQQRIETERARLKRQFALSSTNDEEMDHTNDDDGEGTTVNRNHDAIHHPTVESLLDETTTDDDIHGNGQEFEEESTRAHLDEEDAVADEANRRLGFNMERFLRNRDSFHPELESALEADRTLQSGESATDATKGVVMERFLNDAIDNTNLIQQQQQEVYANSESDGHIHGNVPTDETIEPHRTVAFDVDGAVTTQAPPQSVLLQALDFHQEELLTSIHPSFGEDSAAGISLVSNASMRTEANTVHDEFYAAGDPPLYSTSSLDNMHDTDRTSIDDVYSRISDDEPRVLRLTEADMLEMAAIEEASIGNAPPSDRDDDVESYSEIGELADFGGSGGGMHRFLGDPTFTGPDTPTTALESASQLSQRSAPRGGTSAVSSSATNEHTDVDIVTGHLDLMEGMPTASSDTAHYFVASASASVAANPPSEGGRDVDDDETMDIESHLNYAENEISSSIANLPCRDEVSGTVGAPNNFPVNIAPLTNRQRQYNPNDSSVDGSRIIENIDHDNVVDDFDFDKDEPLSPFNTRPVRGILENDDSFRNLPIDPWSPPGHMHVSPLQVNATRGRPLVAVEESMPVPMENERNDQPTDLRPSSLSVIVQNHSSHYTESTPLLQSDVLQNPPSISICDDSTIRKPNVAEHNSSIGTLTKRGKQDFCIANLYVYP